MNCWNWINISFENTVHHSENLRGLLLNKKLISADSIWKYPAPIPIYFHYEMLLTMYFSVSQFCLLCHWYWHWHALPRSSSDTHSFFFSLSLFCSSAEKCCFAQKYVELPAAITVNPFLITRIAKQMLHCYAGFTELLLQFWGAVVYFDIASR